MKKSLLTAIATLFVLALTGTSAHAALVFSSSYLDGMEEWSIQQPVGKTRVIVATNPAPSDLEPTTKVIRSELFTGDMTSTNGYLAPRAEIYGRAPLLGGGSLAPTLWPDPVGATRWYGFSIYIPKDFPFPSDTSKWLIVTQLKGYFGGSPPVALELVKDRWYLAGHLLKNLGVAVPGKWTRFGLGVKLSTSAVDGSITVWKDGYVKMDKTPVSTMDLHNGQADPIYFKQGVYRSRDIKSHQMLYFGPVKIGTTYTSVKNP